MQQSDRLFCLLFGCIEPFYRRFEGPLSMFRAIDREWKDFVSGAPSD